MSFTMNTKDIEQVFIGMNLPLIERGIDEIQAAKDNLLGSSSPKGSFQQYGQLILSNGTAPASKKNINNAQLERRSR